MQVEIWFWLAALILFLLMEGASAAVISLWFALGSLAALLAAALGASIPIQTGVFMLVSGTSLALLMPLVKKYIRPGIQSTNKDSVIGTVGTVTEEIDNVRSCGRVRLGAMSWAARSSSSAPIAMDTVVRVDRIEGVKVFVTPVPVAERV